jgi:hypothetical protein
MVDPAFDRDSGERRRRAILFVTAADDAMGR